MKARVERCCSSSFAATILNVVERREMRKIFQSANVRSSSSSRTLPSLSPSKLHVHPAKTLAEISQNTAAKLPWHGVHLRTTIQPRAILTCSSHVSVVWFRDLDWALNGCLSQQTARTEWAGRLDDRAVPGGRVSVSVRSVLHLIVGGQRPELEAAPRGLDLDSAPVSRLPERFIISSGIR